MAVPRSSQTSDLQEAFGVFSQVSERLSASYQALEMRVVQLTEELERAQVLRAREQDANGRLANRLTHLLSALPAGVVVLDSHGVVQEYNPAAVDLLGEPLRHAAWAEVIARAFAPRPDDGHEISLRDGRLVSVATRALDPEPGQLILISDRTSTRRLQEQLARHERLASMGEMVASLAHQVRTPLASAMLNVSNLLRPALAEPDRLRLTGKVRERLQHLEHLVNDMLVFARGGVSVAAPVAITPLLTELAQAIEPPMQAAGCRFTLVNHAGAATVLGNREALAGALLNLLSNAMQACVANGAITLSAERTDAASLIVRVQDNGCGIPAEQQAHLFEPFFTTRANGTGLGLAVVQAVAQAHGGEVWIDSTSSAGTRFGLRLPLQEKAA